MKRRDFIARLGATLAAWPVAARGQRAPPVIGFLNGGTPEGYAEMIAAFHQGLKEVGYVVGDNAAIEYRWARGDYDRLPALAAELIRLKVAVIVGNSTPALAALAATTTIPIVFSAPGDPVELGLVTRMNRPGGNVTGVSGLAAELGPKRIELLHEIIPSATTIAALVNPKSRNAQFQSNEIGAAAVKLRLQLQEVHASNEGDLDTAVAEAARLRAGGLVISADPLFNAFVERLAVLLLRYRLPAIYQYREFAAAGALMSYGGSITDQYRLVGVYTGRILKGEKPGDLPVQQASKLDLIINLKTAQALGIAVPLTLRALATEVIE
ncbi:MAG TPA: ABC transporter substrate-binding protein [Xanthobacteraceae bacterium]|jgi:putative ABC transport system substrate-binding protein